MTSEMLCPRCGSADLYHTEETSDPDQAGPSITTCEDCEHSWGEAFPESQAVPLPGWFADCYHCERRGSVYGEWRTCGICRGTGLVPLYAGHDVNGSRIWLGPWRLGTSEGWPGCWVRPYFGQGALTHLIVTIPCDCGRCRRTSGRRPLVADR